MSLAGPASAPPSKWFDASNGLPVPLVRSAASLLLVLGLVVAVSAPLVYMSRGDAAHPGSLIFRICCFGALFSGIYFLPKERRTYILTTEGLDVPSFPYQRRLIHYREIRSVEVRFGRSSELTLNLESGESFATMGLLVENPQDVADFIETRARTARRLGALTPDAISQTPRHPSH
jgi:hypothetical protein